MQRSSKARRNPQTRPPLKFAELVGVHTRSLKDFTPTTHTDEALQQQKEMEEPTVSALAPRVEDRIVPMFHPEYGVGRVFIPPVVDTPLALQDPASVHTRSFKGLHTHLRQVILAPASDWQWSIR